MRFVRVIFCYIVATISLPSAIHGLVIPAVQNARNPSTTFGSKKDEIQIDDFKDINIDDVLLEAENALKAAKTSLVDSGETVNQDDSDGLVNLKEAIIVNDDVNKKKIENDDVLNFKEAIRESLLSDKIEEKGSVLATEILSSTIGGIMLGLILGSVGTLKLSGLDPSLGVLNPFGLAVPIIVGVTVGGVAGFTGSSKDDATGIIVRNVLGLPVKSLASAIVNSIQQAARLQLEKTTNDIKAIPSNVANSAKQKASQKAKEAKIAVEIAVEAAIEQAKKVILVVVGLLSLVFLGMLITNWDIPVIFDTTL